MFDRKDPRVAAPDQKAKKKIIFKKNSYITTLKKTS